MAGAAVAGGAAREARGPVGDSGAAGHAASWLAAAASSEFPS